MRKFDAAKAVLDAGMLSGSAVFVFGLYEIWHPLAPVIGGLLLAGGCWLLGYESPRRGGIR